MIVKIERVIHLWRRRSSLGSFHYNYVENFTFSRFAYNCIADRFTRKLLRKSFDAGSLCALHFTLSITLITSQAFLISINLCNSFHKFFPSCLLSRAGFNVISFPALSRVGEQFNHQKNSFSPEKIQWRFKHEKFCDIFRLGEIQTFSPVPPLSTSYSPKFSATCLATSRRLFITTKHVPQTSDKSYLTRSKSFWPNCRRARSVSRLVSQLDGLAQSKDLKFLLNDDEISPPSRRGAHTKRKFIRFYKSFFRCSLRDDRERRDSFSLFKSLWKILSHFSSRSPEKELTDGNVNQILSGSVNRRRAPSTLRVTYVGARSTMGIRCTTSKMAFGVRSECTVWETLLSLM